MNKRYGFFDVDSRELSPDGNGLNFRERVKPLAGKLNQLYDLAARHEIALVFTTCCSGRMLRADSLPDVLYVPLEQDDDAWLAEAGRGKRIYLQKKTYGVPQTNYTCRAFDVFSDNGNAARLLQTLAVEEWVVFGNGLDLCVNHVAQSILRYGRRVTFLEDVMIPSAKGYDNNGTEENRLAVFENLRRMGAVPQSFASFMAGFPHYF